MRAARCLAYGPPESITIEELPEPRPEEGEVLVDVHAASVNYPDVLIAANRYQVSTSVPFTPGSEFAGVVREKGASADAFAVGDLVCGAVMTGAFAEQVVVPQAVLSRVPNGMRMDDAAAFGVTGRTAFIALRSVATARAGDWVVVAGAAGGVGSAAIDIARRLGCRPVAIVSTEAKRKVCLEWGAEHALDAGQHDLKGAIREVTGGGADVVIDPVGGPLAETLLRAMRYGGRFVTLGYASGEIPRVPLNLVLLKGVHIQGLDVRTYALNDRDQAERDDRDFERLVAEGWRPRLGAVFDLDHVSEALSLVGSRGALGKVVIQVV